MGSVINFPILLPQNSPPLHHDYSDEFDLARSASELELSRQRKESEANGIENQNPGNPDDTTDAAAETEGMFAFQLRCEVFWSFYLLLNVGEYPLPSS